MAHEIRDEETALCMQIKSAYIPEYNDEKEKKSELPDVPERDF